MIITEVQKQFPIEGKTQYVQYTGTVEVADGVRCTTYAVKDDTSVDLAIVTVEPGHKTPRQRVLRGEVTIEGYFKGEGTLTMESPDGVVESIEFGIGRDVSSREVKVGEIMQWVAGEQGLVFYEVCRPPFAEGRFENLPDLEA